MNATMALMGGVSFPRVHRKTYSFHGIGSARPSSMSDFNRIAILSQGTAIDVQVQQWQSGVWRL
jgi:hypothetical protein